MTGPNPRPAVPKPTNKRSGIGSTGRGGTEPPASKSRLTSVQAKLTFAGFGRLTRRNPWQTANALLTPSS